MGLIRESGSSKVQDHGDVLAVEINSLVLAFPESEVRRDVIIVIEDLLCKSAVVEFDLLTIVEVRRRTTRTTIWIRIIYDSSLIDAD